MEGCPFQKTPAPVSLLRLLAELIRERFHFIRTIQRIFASARSDTFRVKAFKTDFYVSADPKLCHEIVADRSAEFGKTRWEHRVLEAAMDDGLIILEGEDWKERRKASASCFGARSMERLAEILRDSLAARTARWKGEINLDHESVCVVNDAMMRFFLDDLKVQEAFPGGSDEFSRAFTRIERGLESRVFDFLFLKERFRALVTPAKSFAASLKGISGTIDQRVRCPYAQAAAPEDSPMRALSSRIEKRESVVNEIRTMLAAGATTAHLVSWMGYLLARDPDRQERLRREIGSARSLTEVERLPYLTAVINEGLRLYPPAPYLIRERQGSSPGERSSIFMFSVWAMHRNPKLWSEPDEFRPERWLESAERIPEGAFIPFGLGPRVCIGKRFAMTEARILMMEMVRNFRLALPDRARVPSAVFTVLTRPDRPVRLAVTPIAAESAGWVPGLAA